MESFPNRGAITWRPGRWIVLLFALSALTLLPWIAVLAVALPSEHRVARWYVGWAGFDVGLALVLAAVAITETQVRFYEVNSSRIAPLPRAARSPRRREKA